MNWIIYRNKQVFLNIFLSLFLLIFLTSCSSRQPTKYSQLDIFDLVSNKEDSIHASRVSTLNNQISNTNKNIDFYKNKIRATKQAINNVKIEVYAYDSLIESASNKIHNINQLNIFLNQLDIKIQSIENEFNRVKSISKGLEKISHSEFLNLKKKGYFSDLTWSDYLDIVKEVVKTKQRIDRDLKEAKKRTRYARNNPHSTLKIISKGIGKGIWNVFKKLTPLGRALDAISTLWDWLT